MADGGNDASGGAPVTSGVIMAAGGQHSDSQRLSKDLEDISASHLTESDCEEELHGEEDETDLEKLPGDGKLQHDLLSHQYGHNTPSKKRSRTPSFFGIAYYALPVSRTVLCVPYVIS